MLAADDLADTITTPRGEPPLRFEPLLPLAAAARLMLDRVRPSGHRSTSTTPATTRSTCRAW
jgi:hypothetical protein